MSKIIDLDTKIILWLNKAKKPIAIGKLALELKTKPATLLERLRYFITIQKCPDLQLVSSGEFNSTILVSTTNLGKEGVEEFESPL